MRENTAGKDGGKAQAPLTHGRCKLILPKIRILQRLPKTSLNEADINNGLRGACYSLNHTMNENEGKPFLQICHWGSGLTHCVKLVWTQNWKLIVWGIRASDEKQRTKEKEGKKKKKQRTDKPKC